MWQGSIGWMARLLITTLLTYASDQLAARANAPAESQPSEAAQVRLRELLIPLRLETPISTKTSRTNDSLIFTVTRPVMAGRLTIIERNTIVRGRILRVKRSRAGGRTGQVWISLEDVSAVDGTRLPLLLSGAFAGSPANETPWPELKTGEVDASTLWLAPVWIPILLAHQLGKHGGQFEAPRGTKFQAIIREPAGLTEAGSTFDVRAQLIQKNALDVDLSEAIQAGSADQVRLLLKQGADVHAFRDRVLPAAAEKGQAGVVEALLDNGVEPGETATALMKAAGAGRISVVDVLLGHMDNTEPNYIALVKGAALVDAARGGHKLVIDRLLAHGIDARGKNAALVKAAAGGHIPAVEALLAGGADFNVQALGSTALIEATKFGHISVARLLIDRGANPKLKDERGRTAERYAAEKHQDELIRLLKDAARARKHEN